MSKLIRLSQIAVLLALSCAQSVLAHEPSEPTYDRISLSASAQVEVPNDRLKAELYVQYEGEDAAQLAGRVNQAVAWALEQSKRVPEVEVRTLDYRTHPLYRKQTLSGWRVQQAISLKSADAAAMGRLIGILQERLAVEQVGYELSPEARREAENDLMARAIAAFRERAEMVSRQFGREGYRLVQVDIQGGGQGPQPMYRAAMAMEADRAPPSLQPGSETVQLTVSGTIELRVK